MPFTIKKREHDTLLLQELKGISSQLAQLIQIVNRNNKDGNSKRSRFYKFKVDFDKTTKSFEPSKDGLAKAEAYVEEFL